MEHASRCSSIDEEVLADTWSEVLVSLEARDDVRCAEKNVSRLRSMSLSVETMADMPVLESPLSSYVIDGNSQSPCSPTSDSASPPGTMRSSKSKVTKRSRLEKTLHLHVDIDILRAVPLRSTLRNFGSLWRMDPGKISKKELQKVFMKSRPSTSYDMFLSHTWVTGGRPKYISILLRFHWHKMLIGWCIATLLAVILVLTGHLRFHLFSSIDLNMSDPPEVPMAPWAMTFGFLASILALVVSPTFELESCRKQSLCFLDIACVHQTDAELRERGVYGIGGWLAVSKEMRILWSPPYFSRLWCVFEVAAYRMANPDGKVIFQPVFVENLVIVALTCSFFICWFETTSFAYEEYDWVFLSVEFLMCVLVIYPLKKMWREERRAIANLATFNLKDVKCSDEDFDRPFVYSAIKGWYGSLQGFTDFVRGPLREDLLGDFSSIHLPFAYYFMMVSPFFGRYLDYSVAMWASGEFENTFVWSYFLAMGISRGGVFVIAIKVLFWLVDYFAKSDSLSWSRDIIEMAAMMISITAIVWGHLQLARFCYNHSLASSLALAGATVVILMCISFRCCSRKPSDRKSTKDPAHGDEQVVDQQVVDPVDPGENASVDEDVPSEKPAKLFM